MFPYSISYYNIILIQYKIMHLVGTAFLGMLMFEYLFYTKTISNMNSHELAQYMLDCITILALTLTNVKAMFFYVTIITTICVGSFHELSRINSLLNTKNGLNTFQSSHPKLAPRLSSLTYRLG